MSRAFTKEDDSDPPPRQWTLPDRDDPAFPGAAAEALLEGARVGDTMSAEAATGFVWAAPELVPYVEQILADAEAADDDRLIQVAERYLRHAAARGADA